jgi:hypothetical protein
VTRLGPELNYGNSIEIEPGNKLEVEAVMEQVPKEVICGVRWQQHVDFLRRWLAYLGKYLMRSGVDLKYELVQGNLMMSMEAAGW